jgi:hypothetical protein
MRRAKSSVSHCSLNIAGLAHAAVAISADATLVPPMASERASKENGIAPTKPGDINPIADDIDRSFIIDLFIAKPFCLS